MLLFGNETIYVGFFHCLLFLHAIYFNKLSFRVSSTDSKIPPSVMSGWNFGKKANSIYRPQANSIMFPQIPKVSTTTLHEIIPLEMKARGDISNESICFRKWALNPIGSASGNKRNFCLLLEHYNLSTAVVLVSLLQFLIPISKLFHL